MPVNRRKPIRDYRVRKRGPDPDDEDSWGDWDPTDPLCRVSATLFQVSYHAGKDVVGGRAKALFDAILPDALALSGDTSHRELLRNALHLCAAIVTNAWLAGRRDLEPMMWVLMKAHNAMIERDLGFDEPFLRACERSPDQPRESLYVKQVKSVAAFACEVLLRMEVKDAAAQIATVINRNGFLPPKRNGKSVVAKSVSNWLARLEAGDLLMRDPPLLFRLKEAFVMRNHGLNDQARRAVLRHLTERLKEIHRQDTGNWPPI